MSATLEELVECIQKINTQGTGLNLRDLLFVAVMLEIRNSIDTLNTHLKDPEKRKSAIDSNSLELFGLAFGDSVNAMLLAIEKLLGPTTEKH